MANGNWSWGQTWTVLGLIAYALSFVVGAGYLGPESGRIAEVIEKEGPESPEACGASAESWRSRASSSLSSSP